MLEAHALEMAERRNVRLGGGFWRRSRGRMSCLSVSKRKNVIDGFNVKTKLAEYPDQKPVAPFSSRISCAICRLDFFGV